MIVLSALMGKILVVGAILFLSSRAIVLSAEQATAAVEMSIHHQIKAARAKGSESVELGPVGFPAVAREPTMTTTRSS